jgi:hypothetical protein
MSLSHTTRPPRSPMEETEETEGELDEIAEGKRAWLPVVAGFYGPMMQALEEARQSVGRVQVQRRGQGPGQGKGQVQLAEMAGIGPGKPALQRQRQRQPQPTGEKCPQCGTPMVVRDGRYGPFTACSGYPRCKYIKKDRPSGWQGQGQGAGAGTGPGSLGSTCDAGGVGSGEWTGGTDATDATVAGIMSCMRPGSSSREEDAMGLDLLQM